MSSEPVRLLEGSDASDAERSLLRAGRSSAPVDYDVAAGAARFRAQLAVLAAAGAVTAGAGAAGGGLVVRAKALLTKLAFKVVLGLMAGGVFAGAGMVAGMHLARTSDRGAAPAPPRSDPGVTASPTAQVVSSASPTPPPVASGAAPPPSAAPAVVAPDARPSGAATRALRETTRHASGAPVHGLGSVSGEPRDAVDALAASSVVQSPVAASAAEPAPQGTQPPRPPQPPAPPAAQAPEPPVSTKPDLSSEVRAVALARSLVERDPEAALDLLEKTRREHPTGYFVEERQALTVVALSRSGHQAAAREQAAAFLRAYPNGPFSDRVRAVAGP